MGWRESGHCLDCSRRVNGSGKRCAKHRRDHARRETARQRRRLKAGRCVRCDRAPEPGIQMCAEHRERSRAANARVYARRREARRLADEGRAPLLAPWRSMAAPQAAWLAEPVRDDPGDPPEPDWADL